MRGYVVKKRVVLNIFRPSKKATYLICKIGHKKHFDLPQRLQSCNIPFLNKSVLRESESQAYGE